MSSSFPNGISSMKLKVSTFEQEISSASLGNNVIQITNENIKNAFNNSPPGTIFNPSISVTYNDSAFPSVTQVTTPTVIPNYVPRIPLPPLSLLANGFTIKYNDDPADVPDSTAKFIQANPRGTGMEWFAVVKQDMKVAMTNYAKGINNAPVNALNFDGVNDGINYGLPALMTGSTGTQFRTTSTLECWFKHPGAPQDIYPTLMARNYSGGNTDQSVFGLDMYNNKVRIFVQTMSGASYIESINTYADSTWHHAAVSYNGQIGELKLYIDGVLDSSYANAALGLLSDSTNSLTNFRVGDARTDWDQMGYRGSIAEVRIWNIIRTPTEIYNNYLNQLVGNENGLILYNRLDQGTANGSNSGINTTTNNMITGGYTGTLQNFSLSGSISNWVSGPPLLGGYMWNPPNESSPVLFNNIVTTLMTDMSNMFSGTTTFNQPINSWDTSNVTNMNYMFDQAIAFNQNISGWDVANVIPKPPVQFGPGITAEYLPPRFLIV